MARSRNIKPGFFRNEYLGMLEPLTRLLFEALWCEADREGRLEDRPLRIKAEYFPYDNCDIDTMLAQLQHSAGNFLTRYEVEGQRFIQITNFKKHQNPHIKEAASVIPPAPIAGKVPVIPTGKALPVPASCKHRACLVLAGLIPDSLLLIPDSLIPDIPAHGAGVRVSYEDIRLAFNKFCPSLPSVREITSVRWVWLKAVAEKYKNHEGGYLRFFDQLFKKVEASDFLAGRSDRGQWCNFDWLLKDDNYVKVIEGQYDNDRQRSTRAASRPQRTPTGREDFTDPTTEAFLSHGTGKV